jgi:hypothetical protein
MKISKKNAFHDTILVTASGSQLNFLTTGLSVLGYKKTGSS